MVDRFINLTKQIRRLIKDGTDGVEIRVEMGLDKLLD